MPLLKKSKKVDGSPHSNPNIMAWTMEPDEPDTGFHGHSQLSLSGSYASGPQVHFPAGGEQLHQLTREEDTAFVLRQAAHAQPSLQQRKVQMLTGTDTPYTPPMGQKRKKDKKKDKKAGKGGKKGETKISAPLNVRHVGGVPQVIHLATPLSEQSSNYPVEHLATMPVDGQLTQISPYESIRKVKNLIQRGDIWTQEVVLAITDSELVIKNGTNKSSMNRVPLNTITACNYLQDPDDQSNVLMVCSQDPANGSRPKMYYFQCARSPAQSICNEIEQASRRYRHMQEEEARRRRRGGSHKDLSQSLGENWILESRPPLSSVPPPSQPPPPPPESAQQSGVYTAFSQANNSPALADPVERRMSRSYTDPQLSSSAAAPYRAEATYLQENRDDSSAGSGGTPLQRQKKIGDFVSRASNKYASNVHAKAPTGKTDPGIKRTMKASRIQRDVDMLNHVFDDLEAFMKLLKDKSTAWNELEKRKKKSKRKKHDAALEALRKKAEPPSEQEFTVTYQKCKFAINLITKLGHHLGSPSPAQLLGGIFKHIQELVQLNKGHQLAAAVVSPLFTKKSIELLTRKLQGREAQLWGQLGGNWFITIEQWPAAQPLPPEYEIEFSDGCIPPNLHNASDCPSNFPTLETLPRGQRAPDYSDVYDGDQPEAESRSGLLINPAVAAVVASKAASVTSPILPGILQGMGTRKHSTGDATNLLRVPGRSSQGSLNSVGSQADPEVKMAKALFDYEATTLEELSIHRGEKVEVLDDSRTWWNVRNRFGQTGFLPSNLMEMVLSPRRFGSKRSDPRDDYQYQSVINYHGKVVPAPPKGTPPPVPRSPSPQAMQAQVRKVSQQPQMSTVPEISESRSSTMARPFGPPGSPHPFLQPPPTFSPAPPLQKQGGVPPAPPAPHAPAPPPPPPVQPPKPLISLSDMIAEHKLKSAQTGKSQKKKLHEQQNRPFDIMGALGSRKPLRKTSTSTSLDVAGLNPATMKEGAEGKMKGRKLSSITENDEIDGEYKALPWKATKAEAKQWLASQGYDSCMDRLDGYTGIQLYQLSREKLRELCGFGDGTRLYSQLQRDKAQAEKDGGAVKESDFQKLMRERKSRADEPGGGSEPTVLRGWGRNRSAENDRETLLDGSYLNKTPSSRRKPILGESPPVLARFGGGGAKRNELESTPRWRDRKYSDDYNEPQRGRGDYQESARDRRGRDRYNDWSLEKRGRRGSRDRYDDQSLRRGAGRSGGGRSRRESAYSDDDLTLRRGKERRQLERQGNGRTKSRRESAYSDDDLTLRRGKGRQRRGRDYEEFGKHKRHGPTNVDDFDEADFESDTESDYYSSESDSEGYSSDSETERKGRLRSSASASELTNAAWALGEGDQDKIEDRTKKQRDEIKKQLASLAELQKIHGVKSLPPDNQKILHSDLQKLEILQAKRKEKPGDLTSQMQLLGQQMLLCEHLKEAQAEITTNAQLSKSPSGHVHSQSAHNIKLQVLQEQQQILAQQQRQILFEQQRQLEAEQQRQAFIAAEQQMQEAQRQMAIAEHQRQMQLAQLAQYQGQQQLQAQQLAGLSGLQVAYNPYGGVVGYY